MLHGDAGWLRSTLPWICVIVTTVINCKGIRTREAGVEIQPSAPVLGTVRPGGVGCAWNAPPTCLRNVLEPVVPASSATPPCVAVDQRASSSAAWWMHPTRNVYHRSFGDLQAHLSGALPCRSSSTKARQHANGYSCALSSLTCRSAISTSRQSPHKEPSAAIKRAKVATQERTAQMPRRALSKEKSPDAQSRCRRVLDKVSG